MGQRGPAPKPTQLKELEGNPGKRRLPKQEPKPPAGRPRKPHGVSRNRVASRFWDEHAPLLEKMQLLTGADGAAFRLMAEHYSVAVQAAIDINSEGMTTRDDDGNIRKHPLLQIFRDNSLAYLRYAREFGLTPSARTVLHVPDDEEQMSLADLLFRAVQGE